MKNREGDPMTNVVRDNFPGITDEQWRGDASYNKGSEWMLEDGSIERADNYVCFFGGGEVVSGKLALADFLIGSIKFMITGLIYPTLSITTLTSGFNSDTHSPKLFDTHYRKYLEASPFRSEIGKLFIERIPDCLDYSFYNKTPGMWKKDEFDKLWWCSQCENVVRLRTDYCPHCGAKML